jgi:putative sigma-54 modulation protein
LWVSLDANLEGTMNITVRGRHMTVAPDIHEYAEEKIGKVALAIDSPVLTVEIELWTERNPSIEKNQVVEVTLFMKGPVIRSREASDDMHAAIDLVSAKLERRIKKYRGKIVDKHAAGPGIRAVEPEPEEEEEPIREVVKVKKLTLKPMTTDEAILEMGLLGHDFFVFASVDTELINVLYKRRDGDLGLIEPRV